MRIAALNIQGLMKPGKRKEVEEWMRKKRIDVCVLQETRAGQNTREARKEEGQLPKEKREEGGVEKTRTAYHNPPQKMTQSCQGLFALRSA